MKKKITRRKALAAGAASTGLLMGTAGKQTAQAIPFQIKDSAYLYPWSPPADFKRDLTPGSTPVRLSCSAHSLTYIKDMNIPERVKSVRDNGYTAAEAGGDSWKEVTDSEIRELNDALGEHDVWFYTLHMCINNIHPDLAERKKINKTIARQVETADRLGLKFVVTHTGSCAAGRATLPHKDNWTAKAWKDSVEAMKQILSDTSGSKVALAVEALNCCNINNPRAHVKLKEDVGDDRIKVTLDPQNMLNLNTCYRTTELVNECFDLLGEDICYAHCKDALLKDSMLPAFEWVVVGTGMMDYEQYLVRLSRLKYTRPLLLEFLPREKYPQARKYLLETAAKVGVTIYS